MTPSIEFWIQIVLYAVTVGTIYGGVKTQIKSLEEKVNKHNNLIERMYKDYYNETQGRYDNRCDLVITPQYTEIDKLLGYSWYTEIDAYMNSMKTVQSFTVNARRRSEYTGNSMSISG